VVKPQTGDLLGTTLQSTAPVNAQVDHTWAGVDRGVSAAGYSNNVAVGKLVLIPGPNEAVFPPLFFFTGTGVSNAIYVDYLDLSHLADYANELAIDQNMMLYYAAAKLGFTPPPNSAGIAQEPEEYLDGQFGGRLRWVSSFAGPNSSVAVVSNGVSILVNSALRFSKIIDSNDNGIPNYYDPYPFNTPAPVLTVSLVQTNVPPSKALAISWNAWPNIAYQVEFATNLPANWQQLLKYTNNTTTNIVVTILDTNTPAKATEGLYRVGFGP
jgi:hypothetical protein